MDSQRDAANLTEGRLRVFRTLHHLNGKGTVVGEPKTKKSRRTIALAPSPVPTPSAFPMRGVTETREAPHEKGLLSSLVVLATRGYRT